MRPGGLIWGLRGAGGGRTDVRTYGRLEIHPCVLQDIGPLGPLPKKDESLGSSQWRLIRTPHDYP